jgi:hypothetical protein
MHRVALFSAVTIGVAAILQVTTSVQEPVAIPPRWTPIEKVAISPDGRRIITVARGPAGLRSFALVGTSDVGLQLTGTLKCDGAISQIAFANRRDLVAITEFDYRGRVHKASDLIVQHTFDLAGFDTEFAFSPDDRYVVTIASGSLYKWKILNWEPIFRRIPYTHEDGSPQWDSSRLIVNNGWPLALIKPPKADEWHLWSLEDPQTPVATSSLPLETVQVIYQEAGSLVGVLAESVEVPDARPKVTLHFTDLLTGSELRRLEPETEVSRAFADQRELRLSPNRSLLGVRTDRKRLLSLFSAQAGQKIQDLESPGGVVSQEWAFVSDRAIVSPQGWKCVFWDLRTGKIALTLIPNLIPDDGKQHPEPQWIAYTPDGFYTGSKDCAAYLGPFKARVRDATKVTAVLRELLAR